MKFKELISIFEAANQRKEKIDGYITFSNESWGEPYPLMKRTYVVSSDNKAFKSGMSGKSIFGTTLDESDTGVRLDRYMAATGNPGGWIIEDCGLIRHQLISIYERDLTTEVFDSQKSAQAAMKKEFAEAADCSVEKIEDFLEEYGDDCNISSTYAWINDAPLTHGNCDWTIIKLFDNGQVILSQDQVSSKSGQENYEICWAKLKKVLLAKGSDALSDFLDNDQPIPGDREKLDVLLEATAAQMPDTDFWHYYRVYVNELKF